MSIFLYNFFYISEINFFNFNYLDWYFDRSIIYLKMNNSFIEIKNVEKTYDDGFTAVSNFNLDIKKGEFVTLLGPSGCGKTTMLKMLAGFERPTHGRIIIDGMDVKNIPINKRPTATVFQDYALFPNMTIFQNISYGLKILRINDKKKYIGEDASPKDIADYNAEEQRINKEEIKNEKIAEIKIANFEKDRKKQEDKVALIKRKYQANDLLAKIGDMPYQQVVNEINILYEQYDNNVTRKSIFHKPIENDEAKALKVKINQLEKALKQKKPIDAELEQVYAKIDKIDYDITYWQNFAQNKREQAEKKFTSRKLNKKEILDRVSNVINLVGLAGNENKYPQDLSGGMRQRVALARAIVIEPDVLLLDEPLSALDAKIRKQMQLELKRIHNQLGITFILVTHDQEEALTLSNKIVVMNFGKIMQIGNPQEIYDSPNCAWVANFIGVANVFTGIVKPDGQVQCLGIITPFRPEDINVESVGKYVDVLIRPEDFDVVEPGQGLIDVTVKSIIYKGLMWQVTCETQNHEPLIVESVNHVDVNKTIGLKWDSDDLHLMKKEGLTNE